MFVMLQQFMENQRATNDIARARHESLLSLLGMEESGTAYDSAAAAAVSGDEEKEVEEMKEGERERHLIRNSRQSVQMLSNANPHSNLLASPMTPAPRARTEQEILRRTSGLVPNYPLSPAATTAVPHVPRIITPALAINRARHSPYDNTEQILLKKDKFYGDAKNAKAGM